MPKQTLQALEELDYRLGSQTVETYLRTVDKHPHLGAVAIFLNSERRNMFSRHRSGLSDSYISLNSDKQPYADRLLTGTAVERFPWAANRLAPIEDRLAVAELVRIVLLHELGHAQVFHNTIQDIGDAGRAFDLLNNERRAQLATLPLGQACTRAVSAWNENIDGYRDSLEDAGIDATGFQTLLSQNRRAYGQLPCEAVPDSFARTELHHSQKLQIAA